MNIVNHTHCTHSMVTCGCVETDILSKHVSLLANLFDLLSNIGKILRHFIFTNFVNFVLPCHTFYVAHVDHLWNYFFEIIEIAIFAKISRYTVLVLFLLSLIVNSLYGNVLVLVAMVKWNIFRVIIVTIITSFSHKIFGYVLHVSPTFLFLCLIVFYYSLPFASPFSLIYLLTNTCSLEILLVATNIYNGSFLYTYIRYMYIHVDSIGQSTLLGIIGWASVSPIL